MGLFGLLLLSLMLIAGPTRADGLRQLVRRADMAYRAQTSAAVMSMKIKTKSYERSYELVAWDETRDGHDRTLVKILGPASWRGHGTLKIDDTLKLYDPKTNHVQVVGHSMLGSSWMGSHFTNDDLVKETKLAEHYELRLEKNWQGKAPTGGRATFYRIALTPKPNAPVAWGLIRYELWENAKAVIPVKADYFRKKSDGRPARTITFSDVVEMADRLVPKVMEVRVARKPGEYTRITYEKLKLNVDIPKSKFTEQALRH
jgi:hypothetical protein